MVHKIDFDDEDAVLDEMAHELDIDHADLSISEESGLSGFGSGTVYEITIRGGKYGKEWRVVENEDQERELALEIVKQDLDEQPEIFEKNFIESHINMDQLRRDLESDVQNSNEERLRDESAGEFWREWERAGMDTPEDENYDSEDPTDEETEELAKKLTEEELKDPMQYLDDIYGDEAAAKAIEIAGIDIDAAAEEAVDTDGPAHFLSSYDGKSYTTKSGLVYWRAN